MQTWDRNPTRPQGVAPKNYIFEMSLLHHYHFITTSSLDHYYIIITLLLHYYYIIITTSLLHIITLLLQCYYVSVTHYYRFIITHYYIIITSRLVRLRVVEFTCPCLRRRTPPLGMIRNNIESNGSWAGNEYPVSWS